MKGFSVEEAKRLREAQDYAAYFSYCSAFADDPEAQAHLAYCCYHGYGVDQDLAQAVDWYAKAAEAGHAQPSTTLAIYTQVYDRRREEIRKQMSRELYNE